jgi:uncharacterized membrane protein YqjE
LVSGALGLLQVRLELFTVEAREEVSRLGGLLVLSALACAFLSLGLGFLAMLITVALWDSHRLLALTAFAVLFLTLGGVSAVLARRLVQRGSRLFEASLVELKLDRERLKPDAAP